MTLGGTIDPLRSLSGLVVGVLVGFTGVGGGSLMTPLLMLGFGVPAPVAVGTDLLFAGLTKSAGAVVHGYNNTVDWRVTAWLASGSLPAAAASIVVLRALGPAPAITRLMPLVLGVAIVLTAASLLLHGRLLARLPGPGPGWGPGRGDGAASRRVAAMTFATGVVLGVLIAFSSVGGGALGVVALAVLYPRLSMARIVGCDIAHAVPLTLLAGLGHWWLGAIDWQLLAALLAGSLPGVVLGSLLSGRVPDAVLRPILAVVLFLVGGKLLSAAW